MGLVILEETTQTHSCLSRVWLRSVLCQNITSIKTINPVSAHPGWEIKKMKKICDIISDNDYIIIHIITRLKYNINRTTSVVKEWEERAGREATAQSTSVDCTTVRLSARETYNQQTKNFVLNLNIKKMESPGKRQKLDNSSQYLVTSFQPILHPYVPPQTLILGNNNISET